MKLRVLALLLLLANLGFYAWTQGWLDGVVGLRAIGDREPERLARQFQPQVIRILAPRRCGVFGIRCGDRYLLSAGRPVQPRRGHGGGSLAQAEPRRGAVGPAQLRAGAGSGASIWDPSPPPTRCRRRPRSCAACRPRSKRSTAPPNSRRGFRSAASTVAPPPRRPLRSGPARRAQRTRRDRRRTRDRPCLAGRTRRCGARSPDRGARRRGQRVPLGKAFTACEPGVLAGAPDASCQRAPGRKRRQTTTTRDRSPNSQAMPSAPPPPLEPTGSTGCPPSIGATSTVLLATALCPASSITVALTVKRPGPEATTAAVMPSARPLKPSTMPPPSTILHCAPTIVRPCAATLPAALNSIGAPASGSAGATAMRASDGRCAQPARPRRRRACRRRRCWSCSSTAAGRCRSAPGTAAPACRRRCRPVVGNGRAVARSMRRRSRRRQRRLDRQHQRRRCRPPAARRSWCRRVTFVLSL